MQRCLEELVVGVVMEELMVTEVMEELVAAEVEEVHTDEDEAKEQTYSELL